MTIDDLIVQLARDAESVQPLPAPSSRLARWAVGALLATAVSVIVIGPRADVVTMMRQPAFAGLAGVTLLTALLAAACALVLSIPGAERSPMQRAFPFVAAAAWVGVLSVLLAAGGDSVPRLLAPPIHPLCIIEIAALAVIPGRVLFGMLRRAAPLQQTWTAALAVFASLAIGAAGTQLLCPIDDPAHQLVGHVVPAAVFAVAGTLAFRRSLDWLHGSKG